MVRKKPNRVCILYVGSPRLKMWLLLAKCSARGSARVGPEGHLLSTVNVFEWPPPPFCCHHGTIIMATDEWCMTVNVLGGSSVSCKFCTPSAHRLMMIRLCQVSTVVLSRSNCTLFTGLIQNSYGCMHPKYSCVSSMFGWNLNAMARDVRGM